jgi:ribonuclease P protein component
LCRRTPKIRTGSLNFETYLSTPPATPGEDARVPCAHEDARRPSGLETPTSKTPPPIDSMKPRAGPQSFPKTLRLLRRAEFRRVYDEGQRRSAPLCSVFYKSNGLAQTRLGITTPRAVGNAVVRNRVKRRLREVFRLHRAAIPLGWDIVLNPRGTAASAPFAQLVKDVLRLLPDQPSRSTRGAAEPVKSPGSPVSSRSEGSLDRAPPNGRSEVEPGPQLDVKSKP